MKILKQIKLAPQARTILRDMGLFLHVPGLMALISLFISLGWGEYYAIVPFGLTILASVSLGQLLYRFRKGAAPARLRHAMITVALSWGIIPLIGAIPFLAIAASLGDRMDTSPTVSVFHQPWNAVFESFSGFTSTGLSMALDPAQLPYSLQWWRSLTEWVGGVGVIVLMLSLLQPTTDAYNLYSAEGRNRRIALTVRSTVRSIWWIYLVYTIFSIFLLKIAGMPWWDALNHGLTGISTGGFSITSGSIGAYAPAIQWATIPIMILGAISFPIHYQLLRRRDLTALWGDAQHRALWLLLILGGILLLLENAASQDSWLWRDSWFQWASALGTCGFNTTDIKTWSPSAKLLMTLGMLIGGAAGSTVGGLKLNRFVALLQAIAWKFQRLILTPHQLLRYRLDNQVVSETEANRHIESVAVLALLWLLLLILGVFALLGQVSPIYTLSDVLFEATSALSSVGLSTGITHPDLAWGGKLVLILFMWMGRLEIMPVLLLFILPWRSLLRRF
ncbi:MAG: TrkH family potassium uptake protein [Spirulinaceae cyanobacterium]